MLVCVSVCACVHVCECMHVYMLVCECVCVHACMLECVFSVCTCTCWCECACTCTVRARVHAAVCECVCVLRARLRACVYGACMCTCWVGARTWLQSGQRPPRQEAQALITSSAARAPSLPHFHAPPTPAWLPGTLSATSGVPGRPEHTVRPLPTAQCPRGWSGLCPAQGQLTDLCSWRVGLLRPR